MDINRLQGAAAYAVDQSTASPVHKPLQDKAPEILGTDLDIENKNVAQDAFKITLSQEAQDILADQTTETSPEAETTLIENKTSPVGGSIHTGSQIVDTVA